MTVNTNAFTCTGCACRLPLFIRVFRVDGRFSGYSWTCIHYSHRLKWEGPSSGSDVVILVPLFCLSILKNVRLESSFNYLLEITDLKPCQTSSWYTSIDKNKSAIKSSQIRQNVGFCLFYDIVSRFSFCHSRTFYRWLYSMGLLIVEGYNSCLYLFYFDCHMDIVSFSQSTKTTSLLLYIKIWRSYNTAMRKYSYSLNISRKKRNDNTAITYKKKIFN